MGVSCFLAVGEGVPGFGLGDIELAMCFQGWCVTWRETCKWCFLVLYGRGHRLGRCCWSSLGTMEHSLLKCLVFLSLCSAFGSALECYVCETKEDSLCQKQTCAIGLNACLNVTFQSTYLLRRCWSHEKCNSKDIELGFTEYVGTQMKYTCCSWDLCNSKNSDAPGAPAPTFLLGLLSVFAGLHLCWFRN